MPAPGEILSGLESIANAWKPLAIFWHGYFAAVLFLVAQPRTQKRLVGLWMTPPLLSVSALAWMSGNPFNGILFAVVGVGLSAIAIRLPRESTRAGAPWAMAAGALLFAFAWVYPHFLRTTSFVPYLYEAPMGLIPCPTLSAVTGIALIGNALESRALCLTVGAAGIFYGAFGVLRLGVTIDGVLLGGAVLLAGLGSPLGRSREV